MKYLPGEGADHQHIRDQQAAARFDAERDWDGWHPDDEATWEDAEPMPRQDCDCGRCGRCLRCALAVSLERSRA